MGVRVKRLTNTAQVETNPQIYDATREQREVTVDGYTFHFGMNEVKNFLDEGVGAAVAAFSSTDTIVENDKSFGSGRT
jgi:hypothetical protein